jgi:hypothetical protein
VLLLLPFALLSTGIGPGSMHSLVHNLEHVQRRDKSWSIGPICLGAARRLLLLSFGSGHPVRRYALFLTLDSTRIRRSLNQSAEHFELRAAEMHALPLFRAWLHWRFPLVPCYLPSPF